jgi:hypothetical protein
MRADTSEALRPARGETDQISGAPEMQFYLMFERYVSTALTLTCSCAAIVPESMPRPIRSKTSGPRAH